MVVNPNNGEIYITAHRLFSPIGMVPYSLGVQRSYEFNAPVYPFPSFEENQNAPYGIYSAVSTTQDKCGNLWIVDQGIKTITDPQPVYPPGLFAYNFAARKITYRYRFPQEFFTDRGTTTTRLIVDSYYGCDKMKLIVADTLNYCLLVHDMETGSSWKVCHPTMNYDPKYADFKYENYTLSDLPTGVYRSRNHNQILEEEKGKLNLDEKHKEIVWNGKIKKAKRTLSISLVNQRHQGLGRFYKEISGILKKQWVAGLKIVSNILMGTHFL
uniref:Bee-milk protein n=1 Tax=Megaselia scalaris TaxID=36166 RepID=T1GIT8_MEGSC